MKSSEEQLRKRGYIVDNELELYYNFSKKQLLELLHSKEATNRTVAAKLLVKYKEAEVLKYLISSLTIEKKLYTKIALAESISEYGELASEMLIKYLGKVGYNQHKSLPIKPFNKKNYPLPRDIMARTLCKIGKPAIKALRSCLNKGEYIQVLEAIDAVGFISYYEDDGTAQDEIFELFNRYKGDDLMIWKLIRALQSFKDQKAIEILKEYSTASIEQHRWEAIRSINQINRK